MMDLADGLDLMHDADGQRPAPRPRPPRDPLGWAVILSLALLPIFGCDRQVSRSPQAPVASAIEPASELPAGGDLSAVARQTVLAGLADSDPRIRANAVEVVASAREVGLMPQVPGLLADKVVPVRFAALLAVGDLKWAAAKDSIAPLLKDPNPNIRIAACYVLSRFGQSECYQSICEAIASNDQTVRANAALLLGKSGNKDGIRFLYWTLQRDDSSDTVVLQTAEAIAMLRDPRIYKKLWTMLISLYTDDRVIGIRAMGALGTDEAKNAIVTMLDDPVPEVRLAAAGQLGKLGDTAGEAEVLAVFEKNLLANLDVQGQERAKILAALAIGEIGKDCLAKYLPTLLQDPSKAVRLAAARAVLRRNMKK
jgi:HEAT repeat protein